LDEITRHPATTDADHHTDRPTRHEQREHESHQAPHPHQEHPVDHVDQVHEAPAPPTARERGPRERTGSHAVGHTAAQVSVPATGHAVPEQDTGDFAAPGNRTDRGDGPEPADVAAPAADDAAAAAAPSDAATPTAAAPADAPGPAPAPAYGVPGAGVAALLRLAVLCVDHEGRIS